MKFTIKIKLAHYDREEDVLTITGASEVENKLLSLNLVRRNAIYESGYNEDQENN